MPGENLLGREAGAVVWLDSASVSRRHARIVVTGETATLEDLYLGPSPDYASEALATAIDVGDSLLARARDEDERDREARPR